MGVTGIGMTRGVPSEPVVMGGTLSPTSGGVVLV